MHRLRVVLCLSGHEEANVLVIETADKECGRQFGKDLFLCVSN
jgi:hypothetical protein